MQLNVRIRRWVIWWFYVGVFCGGIALANIFGRDLTPYQDRVLLLIGALHWILGGIVCWAFQSVKLEHPAPPPEPRQAAAAPVITEWHPASEFLLPGNRRSLLPPSVALRRSRKSLQDSLRVSGGRP